MAKARAVSTAKAKKKFWYPIFAPKDQNGVMLGETYVEALDSAIGRTVHANLKTVTDNMRDQNVYLDFKITHAKGDNLYTEVIGYTMTPPSIKKIARRNTSRIDDSFVVVTKDSKKVRIKTVAVTRHAAVHSLETALRKKSRDILAREISKLDFAEVIKALTGNHVQNSMKKRLAKIYPLRTFQVKVLQSAEGERRIVKAKEEVEDIEAKKEAPVKQKRVKREKKSVSEEMVEELKKAADPKDSESFGEE